MRIKRVVLRDGYKRFHHLTIDLGCSPAKVVALVGTNGCGKSSVFDGILALVSTSASIGQMGTRDHTYHTWDQKNFNPGSHISIEFDKGDFINVIRSMRGDLPPHTIVSFRSCYRYNQKVKVSDVKAIPEIVRNNYGASCAADIDAKMEQNYRRLFGLYNAYLDDTDSRPSEAKAKIMGDLNVHLRKCLDIEIVSLGNIERNQGTLFFTKSDQKLPFAFDVLSAGEKEAVDILLDLYLRKEAYAETIYIIDEPELHINTAIQRRLLAEVCKLIPADCQLWVATHSVGFLRALQEDLKGECQIIHFRQEYKYASEPVVLTPIKPGPVIWREIFSTALDDLADLVSPRRIIYCEGRANPGGTSQELGLDARVFNAIFSSQYPDTLFVSSGGNTELDQRSAVALSVLSKVYPAIEILVLKDRDIGSGKMTTEKDRQIYLSNNPGNHRVLKRFEIENYLFDKSVLISFCSSNNTTFDAERYDRLVKDIVNDDVKAQVGVIKAICGISTSINPEVFKLNLAELVTPQSEVYAELVKCIFDRQ